ncbi:MAG: hypothetical protein QM767_05840 [Anaeromyxobacter sp.]
MATTMERAGERALPRLSWGPIIAGVLLSLAAHVVLGLVGAALGMAAEPADSGGLGAAAAIWALLTPFVATLLGAWLACRLAAREDTAGTNLHGVMVWCIGLLAGALFLTGTAASSAVVAGTAASGNAGALMRNLGAPDTRGPVAEARADEAGKRGAALAGGAAMAALCGLLGAFAGAGIARARREGRGLGWKIAIQRAGHHEAGRPMPAPGLGARERGYDKGLPGGVGGVERGYPAGPDERPAPADPYHH